MTGHSTAESRAAAVLAAHPGYVFSRWSGAWHCDSECDERCPAHVEPATWHRAHVAAQLAAASLLADDGQASGEPDGLRAAVEAVEEAHRRLRRAGHVGGALFVIRDYATELRAALAANPPTSGSKTDRG